MSPIQDIILVINGDGRNLATDIQDIMRERFPKRIGEDILVLSTPRFIIA